MATIMFCVAALKNHVLMYTNVTQKALTFMKETKSFLNTLTGLNVKTYMQYTMDLSYSHNPRLYCILRFVFGHQSKTK